MRALSNHERQRKRPQRRHRHRKEGDVDSALVGWSDDCTLAERQAAGGGSG